MRLLFWRAVACLFLRKKSNRSFRTGCFKAIREDQKNKVSTIQKKAIMIRNAPPA